MKKKILTAVMIAVILILNKVTASERIDYGHSEIFSREDMDSAITIIKENFQRWECEIHSIRYTDDEYCNTEENIKWMNELAEGRNIDIKFDECIAFFSDFHSPRNNNNVTLESDIEYKNWTWYFARSNKGQWHLMTFGY